MRCSKKIKESNVRRANQSICIVFYRLQNTDADEMKESFVRDIKGNRLIFVTQEPIDPNTELECEIYQQSNIQTRIIIPSLVSAKVVRMEKINNDSDPEGNRCRVEARLIKRSVLKKNI